MICWGEIQQQLRHDQRHSIAFCVSYGAIAIGHAWRAIRPVPGLKVTSESSQFSCRLQHAWNQAARVRPRDRGHSKAAQLPMPTACTATILAQTRHARPSTNAEVYFGEASHGVTSLLAHAPTPAQSRALLIKSHDPHCLCSHQASGICVATTFHRYTHHIFLRSPSATNASHSCLGRHAATTSCNACYSFLEVARGSNIDTSCNVLAPNEHLRPKRRRTRLRNM